MDADGWGSDAPQVTRTQLEKVQSAYKPTKVNISELTSQKQEPSRFAAAPKNDTPEDVVRGGYQPIGKVDIAAIRRQAQESGGLKDDRPIPVKGSYEPVGKVDIAAIRAKAQAPAPRQPEREEEQESSRSLADRSAAFSQSERLTELPKPKVSNRFGSSGAFTGTKAPAPGGFVAKPIASTAPVGAASKTFADEGGKTPAQIWAEKKAKERGISSGESSPAAGGFKSIASPIKSQSSGGWQSGYTGKKWNAVQTTHTGKSATSNNSDQNAGQEEPASGLSGGVSAARERFAGAPPIGVGRPSYPREDSEPPPLDTSSKPNAGARGVPIPGLPNRSAYDDADDDVPAVQSVNVPPPPAQRRSPSPPPDIRSSSPIRIIQPVARGKEAELEPAHDGSSAPVPRGSLAQAASTQREDETAGRRTAQAAAAATFGGAAVAAAAVVASSGGKRAVVQYDYEKAEDNEIELREGDFVTEIDQVDEDWYVYPYGP